MKGLLKHRPSPALVISIIALVMATIGTALAATNLPKNSVGSKQLKKNAVVTNKIKKEAVTGAKIKKNTLTGQNIKLTTLGTVPSAANANTATVAQSLTPLEPIHRVGAAGEPPFEAGAQNFGPFIGGVPTQTAGYYKDHEGIVHLVGLVKTGASGAIFRLPAGFRPAGGLIEFFNQSSKALIVAGSNVGEAGMASGIVILFGGALGDVVSLSGVTFRGES
jgi:hypothetical protein